MITVRANARNATYISNDLITSGSVGIPVTFNLSEDFDGLSAIAVFEGSGTARDVALIGDSCVVPHEVLTTAGGYLRIGIYASNSAGTIVIPTVWAGSKMILQGTEPSEVDPSEPTPSWVAQVQAAAAEAVQTSEEAIEIAGGAQAAADDARESASAAAGSATAAAQSESAASGYATSASGSASAAAQSATGAAGSASNAASSASAAAGSATAAAGSAEAAAASEAAAREVLESIPQDYSELSEDVSELKSQMDYKTDSLENTISGTVVTIIDGANTNAFSIVCHIEPEQSGSETPSPQNDRPLIGYNGLTLKKSGSDTSDYDTVNVEWEDVAGTIYGGYVDVVSGEIVVEWKKYIAANMTWSATSKSSAGVFLTHSDERDISKENNIICDRYKTVGHNVGIGSMDDLSIKGNASATYADYIYIRDARYTDLASFVQHIDATFIVQLASPIHYQISGKAVKLIRGINHIWSNTNGNCSVTYAVDNAIYVNNRTTYVTPEQYGAVGDGLSNDVAAVNSAISAGAGTGKIVLCSRKYYVSQPIEIPSNSFVIINELNYAGNDTAVIVQGSGSLVKIKKITSAGVGIKLSGNYTDGVIRNHIIANVINAGKDGIVLESVTKAVSENKIEFSLISAGGTSYYGIRQGTNNLYITENTFTGGSVTNAHYAMKEIGGNSHAENFCVEGNIKGGFLNCRGLIVDNDRHWECCNTSDEPYIKFTLDISETDGFKVGSAFLMRSLDVMPFNQIDLSGVSREWDGGNKVINTSEDVGMIECPFNVYVANHESGSENEYMMARRAYLFGNALIFEPYREYLLNVDTDLDLSTITKNTKPFATSFIVESADVEIKLHASYCWLGYNRFTVSQRNGSIVKVYEWYQNRCVFDGTNVGDGNYEIECYIMDRFVKADGSNMYWRYKKLSDTYINVIDPA